MGLILLIVLVLFLVGGLPNCRVITLLAAL